MASAPDRPWRPRVVQFVRWWLPAIVIAGGVVALILDPTLNGLQGAAEIVGAGLAILLLNLLVRVGISGDRERDAEDEARAYFEAHGHWPDESPPPPRAPRRPRPAPPQHR